MTSEVLDSHGERLRRIGELTDAIRERAAALDESSQFPADTFADLRAAGLIALTVPQEDGGEGLWWEGRYRAF